MTLRSPHPTICVGALWRLLDAAAERGVSAEAVMRAVGFDAELLVRASPTPLVDRRLPVAQQDDAWRYVMSVLRNPALPIEMARTTRVDAFSLFGFLLKTSPTVGAAFDRSRRYFALWTQGGVLEHHEADGGLEIVYRRHNEQSIGARCSAEVVMAEMVAVTRELLGESRAFDVDFAHAALADVSAHEAYFKGRVQFARGRNALYVPRELVNRALNAHDQGMLSYFEAQAVSVLESLGARDDITTLTSRCVIALLPTGDANLENVAEKLGTSGRTLRRRLEDAGTTFDGLLTRTRRELADRYLRDPRVSVGEAALLLGFAEQTSFQRAYRRWTGMTPGAYRAQLRNAAP